MGAMPTVTLVKNGRELAVSSYKGFVDAVYGQGYLPKTGSIGDNWNTLSTGVAAPPDLERLVRASSLPTDLQEPAVQKVLREASVAAVAESGTFATTDDLAAVATSGSYADLEGLPSIPELSPEAVEANLPQRLAAAQLRKFYLAVLTPEQFGAVGDGTTNDTAALQQLAAALSDGDVVQCAPGAVYRFTLPLNLSRATGFRWHDGAFVFAGTQTSTQGGIAAIRFAGTDFVVEGLHLTVETQTQQYDGLRMQASTRGVFRRCYVEGARWSGIAIVGSGSPSTAQDCQVLESAAIGCYVGIFSNGRGTKIDRCLTTMRWSTTQEFIDKGGIWSAPSLYYDGIIIAGTGWSITNCRIEDNGQSGIYAGGGANDGVIANNLIVGNGNKGIDLGVTGTKSASNSINRITITGNVVRDNATGEIHLNQVDKSTVIGNTCLTTNPAATGGGIIINGMSMDNLVIGNAVQHASASVPGVFVNDPDGAARNVIAFNRVDAQVRYVMNAAKNTLIETGENFKLTSALKDGPTIDLSALTGFDGREVLNLITSADNAYAQITTAKKMRVTNSSGVRQALEVGGLDTDNGLSVTSGLAFFANSVTVRLPQTPSTSAGAIWYNATTGQLNYRDGVAGVNRVVPGT